MFRGIKKTTFYFAAIPLLCFLFYTGLFKSGPFEPDFGTHLNYFRHLADAFLNGRMYLENIPSKEDLVEYNHQFYAYWPPVPALVYMPLVALFGNNLPDALINSLFGVLNVWLVMQICARLNKKFSLALSMPNIALTGIFWGLGTVQFYMSMNGSVWFVSQIMAQTFMLASVFLLMKEKLKWHLWWSGICFACAVYTRNHFVFAGFFIVFLYQSLHPEIRWKQVLRQGGVFVIPFLFFSILNAWYNYARFGNVFENGLKYHIMSAYFEENFSNHGYFSLHYFPHNFFTEVLHLPTITSHSPFIQKEPEGFGFIWGSPVFLLLVPAVFLSLKKRTVADLSERNHRLIKTGAILSALAMACIIFSIMGTGWVQFCARYTLDFQFFLLLFLLFSKRQLWAISFIKTITIILLLVSVGIQYIGACVY